MKVFIIIIIIYLFVRISKKILSNNTCKVQKLRDIEKLSQGSKKKNLIKEIDNARREDTRERFEKHKKGRLRETK